MVFEKYRIELSHYLYDTEKTGYNEYNTIPVEVPIYVELTFTNDYSRHWAIEEVAKYMVEKLKEAVENDKLY